MADLEPAETNPWYVLSTLHGVQRREGIDYELAAKNVALWNVWSCQNMTEEEREKLREAGADVPDDGAWKDQKKEIERLFQKRFSEMGIGKDEMPEISDAQTRIDMSKIAFSHTVVWEKAIFGQVAYFSSATFEQDASFTSATFAQNAYFSSAKFEQDASFSSATFAQNAYFSSAKFEQDASFSSATFEQVAYFFSATFEQFASFFFATFAQYAFFGSATFAQAADFTSAKFAQAAFFDSATFSGFAYFRETRFGTDSPLGEDYAISFSDAIFERPTTFREARFKHRYPMLDGTVFHDKTQVTAEREFWPEGAQPDPKQAKEACATLRHVVAKQSLPEDEYFFFRCEMEFAGEIGGFWRRLPYKSYGWVSDYGTSIVKPATRLFGVWLVFAILYMSAFNWPGVVNAEVVPAGKGFGFSLANMFKFFGFQRTYYYDLVQNLPSWLQFAAAAQTVLSYILVFFLGLGLRARFRLR